MFFPEIAKLIVNDVSPNGNHDDQNHKANSGWEDVSREGGGGSFLGFSEYPRALFLTGNVQKFETDEMA